MYVFLMNPVHPKGIFKIDVIRYYIISVFIGEETEQERPHCNISAEFSANHIHTEMSPFN